MILTPISSLTPLTTEVKCIVDSIQCDTIDNNRRSARTTFGIVPADLQSAGIEYKDLFNPITSYLASSYTFNANIALNFSLLTS